MNGAMPEVLNQFVYVLTNPAMPGLVKIGMTTQAAVQDRVKQLFTTALPVPFECNYACRVHDAGKVEKALHFAFGSMRVNPNREFFELEPECVAAVLRLLAVEDVTKQIEETIEAEAAPADLQSAHQFNTRRPRMRFHALDIPNGSVLVFKDGTAQATVVSDTTVEHMGMECSLTSATRAVLGLPHDTPLQPSPYWSFHGKSVKQIYEDYHAGATST